MKISMAQLKTMVRKQVTEKLIQDDCPGNKLHKKDGTFGSDKNDGSWSISGKDCDDTGQHKMSRGKKLKSNAPCGRKNRKKLCQEQEVEELYCDEKTEQIIRDTIKQELEVLKRGKGGCSWQQILNAMNKVDRARDGKLYAK
jgi:hypothetical protein